MLDDRFETHSSRMLNDDEGLWGRRTICMRGRQLGDRLGGDDRQTPLRHAARGSRVFHERTSMSDLRRLTETRSDLDAAAEIEIDRPSSSVVKMGSGTKPVAGRPRRRVFSLCGGDMVLLVLESYVRPLRFWCQLVFWACGLLMK